MEEQPCPVDMNAGLQTAEEILQRLGALVEQTDFSQHKIDSLNSHFQLQAQAMHGRPHLLHSRRQHLKSSVCCSAAKLAVVRTPGRHGSVSSVVLQNFLLNTAQPSASSRHSAAMSIPWAIHPYRDMQILSPHRIQRVHFWTTVRVYQPVSLLHVER